MYEYLTGIFILIICLIIYFTYYYILDKEEVIQEYQLDRFLSKN